MTNATDGMVSTPAPKGAVNGRPESTSELPAGISTSAFARRVLGGELAALQEQENGVRHGSQEPVHDMRVAARRLRAALKIFRAALPAPAASLEAELKWLGERLGAVRDLDVQVKNARRAARDLHSSKAFAPYRDFLRERRSATLTELIDALDSPRYAALVERLAELVTDEDRARDGEKPLLKSAPRSLRGAYRKLRSAADALDVSSPPALFHEARKKAKYLRYAAEFVEPVYGPRAGKLAAAVVTFQDELGTLQDGVVAAANARRLLRTDAAQWPSPTVFFLGEMVQRERDRGEAIRSSFPSFYKPIRGKRWERLHRRMRGQAAHS